MEVWKRRRRKKGHEKKYVRCDQVMRGERTSRQMRVCVRAREPQKMARMLAEAGESKMMYVGKGGGRF